MSSAGLRRVPLSVLDLAPIGAGMSVPQALQQSLTLARHAESLGFTRFWLAEHHNSRGIASSAPAVLISAVAAATERIRVGSGGVMLPNHSPLVVAEQFGTLEGLYPGRIDLGLGRAPGTDQVTAHALRRGVDQRSGDDFAQQLGELLAFFRNTFPEGHPYGRIAAVPAVGSEPPIWLLGSSGYSAQAAGMLGMPFAFANHFSSRNTEAALDIYREHFTPSPLLDRPYAIVTIRLVIADTDEQAEFLAGSSLLSFLRMRQGRPGPLPTAQEAADHPWTEEERAIVAERLDGQAVGDPASVRDQLAALLDRTGADELMATSLVHDPVARLATFTRLRELFDAELPLGLSA